MEQRSLLRHCLYTAELAQKHVAELRSGVTDRRFKLNDFQRHLAEVREAVQSMLELHKRFIGNLSEEQWTTAKGKITTLEALRGSIEAQLQGIDYELQMPTPDSKVLARYGKKLEALLQDWRKQHRKMGAAVGIKL